MSHLARTPESHAAWQRIMRNRQLRPEDQFDTALEKSGKELDLLVADMQESPTLEKLEEFFKRSVEHSQITMQSLAWSAQSFRDQELCKVDIRASEEENRRIEAENQRLAEKRALVERIQQQYAENERLILSLGLPTRRDSEGHLVCCCGRCNTHT